MKPLPVNCEASYWPGFLAAEESTALFEELLGGYDITNKAIRMADGSEHIADTAAYLFADPELTSFDVFPEAWGGRSSWPDSLARIRDRIALETGTRFQVARCVYYRDGSEAMGFHSDPPAYHDFADWGVYHGVSHWNAMSGFKRSALQRVHWSSGHGR